MTDATLTSRESGNLTDAQKTARIKETVIQAGVELRQRHPWLRHQDAIGAGIMLLSLAGMIGTATLYAYDLITWWLCIPLVAIFASFIHELEHDLIHLMYFRKTPWANKLMLLVGWIARPSTVNPFVRRELHLHHHKHSGTATDLEERGITNGEPWGIKRLLMTGDNMLAVYLRPSQTYQMVRAYIASKKPRNKAEVKAMARQQRLAYFPIGTAYYLMWHGFLAYTAIAMTAQWFGHPLALSPTQQRVVDGLDFLAVTWMLPSFLRTFCLHLISSNMHYYGDVEDGNVLQQTQVLNAWWLLPFQLFCFNFGSTHAIHHFVVKEPFYVRQWTAATAHRVMRDMGVRFNDFGTFRRANRWQSADAPTREMGTSVAA